MFKRPLGSYVRFTGRTSGHVMIDLPELEGVPDLAVAMTYPASG